MYNPRFKCEDFGEEYKTARRMVEILCAKIVLGIITAEQARIEYEIIEMEFKSVGPDKAELFNMIYSNRVERLATQFPARSI
jgi:hypothetical protein